MPRASTIQNSFTGGELSPLLLGRQDIDKYRTGLQTCLNAIPLIQGAWTRRPANKFLKTTKFGAAKISRLLPFRFSTTQAYTLEFGDLYVRFFTQQAILTETAQAIVSVTQAATGVMEVTGHGYSDGDRLHVDNVVGGMHQLRLREVEVNNSTANTFELRDIASVDIDTSGFDAFTSGGTVGKIIEVVTPYTETDIADLRVTQSADVLYLFHPDFKTRSLTRLSATSWSMAALTFFDGPYDVINTFNMTLTPSATTGTITITASSIIGINGGAGFKSTDVGRLVRLLDTGTWGHAEITVFTSTTLVTAVVQSPLGGTTPTASFRMGVWSDTTGFPVFGTFHEDRLWAGGAALFSQRIDGSRTGRFTNVQINYGPSDADGTVADDHAVAFTMNSNDVNNLRWLLDDEKALLAGTEGGEWSIRPSSLSEAITPSNISGKKATGHGSANIAPVRAAKAILFVQRSARKLRELSFVFERDGFSAPDLSLLSEHITSPSIVELAYQQQPQSILWCARADKALLGFTYERDQDVVGWHRHLLGGPGDSAGNPAKVESLTAIPAPDGSRDEVYMIVTRHINGADERYVELMTKIWESGDLQVDAFYLDSGLTTVSVGGTTEVLGLSHLEGETISVYTDGAVHPDQAVTNGKITLDVSSNKITVGYAYNSDGLTMPSDAGAADGSAQGKTRRINRVGMWLFDTLGIKIGPDADNLTEVLIREWGDAWGAATPLFTGVIRERFEGLHDRLGEVFFRADGPFPATVLALMIQVKTEDDS